MCRPNHADGYLRVWNEMAAAVTNRRHGFHTCTLATVDAGGHPEARTMILRGADPERRAVRFHSDARSPKLSLLRENPAVCAVFYGATEKLQVRAYGDVTVHHADPVTAQAWDAMQPMSREVYRTPFAPGSQHSDTDDQQRDQLPVADAYNNFAVCVLTLSAIESLFLSSEGHERTRYQWDRDGILTTHQLHP